MKLAVVLSCLLIHVSLCERARRRSVLGESCITPFKDPGDCRNIENCQKLLEVRKDLHGERSADVSALLTDSVCESTGVEPPLYCCPHLPLNTTTPAPTQPPSSPSKCGNGGPINRILGGGPADLGQWPWMAVLGRRDSPRSSVYWFCGGALVTDRHVITAAHCSINTRTVVRLGELKLEDGGEDGASPVDKQVESFVRHPEYEDDRFVNDIAVIKLKGRVETNGLIQPICLPNAAIPTSYVGGEKLDVAGWGNTSPEGQPSSVLQQVSVPVASESTCREAYRDIKERVVIDERVICAGNGDKDTCQGDSGGPLMDNKNGLFYLIGVVSFGQLCGTDSSPGVYMRVSYYMDWINANMNSSLLSLYMSKL